MSPVEKIEKMLAARNVKGIGNALRDRNVIVRRSAAQALGELQDPAGVRFLAQSLTKETDEFVRQWGLESLRKIGGDEGVHALMEFLFSTDRRVSTLAGQALSTLAHPQAVAAISVRDAVARNDWATLEHLGMDAQNVLSILLSSDLYRTWPSGKRNEILNLAIKLGATPPVRYRRELAAAGIFLSGVHTIGDLIKGLGHRSPLIRIAAARKLGEAGKTWTARPLYRRFLKEIQPGGDHSVAVATAQAMAELGDQRAIEVYRHHLSQSDGRQVEDAARALTEIGTHETVEMLFWFVVSPPLPTGFRNVPIILSTLEAAGPQVINQLSYLKEHEKPTVRRLLVELIARCGAANAASLLHELAQDNDLEVQHAALDTLASLNTEEAVQVLCSLTNIVPRNWVLRTLAMITHPSGPEMLHRLDPSSTTLVGRITDNHQPLGHAGVQILQEHIDPQTLNTTWRPNSPRAETGDIGAFALSIFSASGNVWLRIKVVTPIRANGQGGEVFTADFVLESGKSYTIEANIDRFFSNLIVDIGIVQEET